MKKSFRLPTLAEIESAFFSAMSKGYIQNLPPEHTPKIPGLKTVSIAVGDLLVIDSWVTTPISKKSSGTTTISHRRCPVWIMHYGGWFEEDVVPFLKAALYSAYMIERKFYGGRGPVVFDSAEFPNWVYRNTILRNSFQQFSGQEEIHTRTECCLGYHWYRGMSLLP
ncbi:MAG: hypothetical protein WC250_03095 [Candidatus Paceibacterota bacterium]|jgi:hypothetical protein